MICEHPGRRVAVDEVRSPTWRALLRAWRPYGTRVHGRGWVLRPLRDVQWPRPGSRHLERATWLAAQCEGGGRPGPVTSADGAGYSIGILHHPSVLPATKVLGAVHWRLVRAVAQTSAGAALAECIERAGWTLGPDGCPAGVDAQAVLAEQIHPSGVLPVLAGTAADPLPAEHARSLRWGAAYCEAMLDPRTHALQLEAAVGWLRARAGARDVDAAVLGPELDLALAAYLALAVQAPGPAADALRRARSGDAASIVRELLVTVGKREAWPDRWTTIRAAARGLWGAPLVERLLPRAPQT